MTNSYREVYEVLKLAPKQQLKMIPSNVLNQIQEKASKEKFDLKFNQMGEPKLSYEAQTIILGIYKEFLLPNTEKTNLDKLLIENDKKNEIAKVQNYNNPNDIFYNSSKEKKSEKPQKIKKADMIIIEEKNVIAKLKEFIEKIKKYLHFKKM